MSDIIAQTSVNVESKEQPVTWELLCGLEPRLLQLYDRAKNTRDDGEWFCANKTWKAEFRRELDRLVGFHVPPDADPRLRTFAAHNVARAKIWGELPDCRGCSCVDVRSIIEARMSVSHGR